MRLTARGVEYAVQCLADYPDIKSLDFSGAQLDGTVTNALAQQPQIHSINLSRAHLDGFALAHLVENNTTLKSLDISDNPYRCKGGGNLSSSLVSTITDTISGKNRNALESIHLPAGWNLDENVFAGIENNHTLVDLKIEGRDIPELVKTLDDKNRAAIIAVLERNKNEKARQSQLQSTDTFLENLSAPIKVGMHGEESVPEVKATPLPEADKTPDLLVGDFSVQLGTKGVKVTPGNNR